MYDLPFTPTCLQCILPQRYSISGRSIVTAWRSGDAWVNFLYVYWRGVSGKSEDNQTTKYTHTLHHSTTHITSRASGNAERKTNTPKHQAELIKSYFYWNWPCWFWVDSDEVDAQCATIDTFVSLAICASVDVVCHMKSEKYCIIIHYIIIWTLFATVYWRRRASTQQQLRLALAWAFAAWNQISSICRMLNAAEKRIYVKLLRGKSTWAQPIPWRDGRCAFV